MSLRLFLCCLLALCACCGAARATCTFAGGDSLQSVVLAFPATLSVPRETAVGTVLATVAVAANPATGTFANCTSPGNAYRYMSSSSSLGTIAGYPTFATSVPGIGLQAYFQDGSVIRPFVANGSGSQDSRIGAWAWSTDGAAQWVARLVVTGSISAGSDSGSLSASVSLDSLPVAALSFGSFTVNALGCTTPDVTVNLGSYATTDFRGVNRAMRPAPVGFSIAVNACPAGMNSVQYLLHPTTSVLNSITGLVALDASSSAAGIGIAIRDGSGNAILFDHDYTLSAYSSATGGSYTIPLEATYVQTSTSITPGSANTSLEFTMTYQ